MKFRVTLKDPDTLCDAVDDAVTDQISSLLLDPEETDAIIKIRKKNEYSKASVWFQYGEYLTVEIDTDAGTCVVVKDGMDT